MMFRSKQPRQAPIVLVRGKPYRKQVLLADANIPYKLSVDRSTNHLFFCINADEFSDQSFHSAVMNLETRATSIVPGIRNGFASAVDHSTSSVYLGGSDGIYKYNYNTNDVMKPALVNGIDIFDMYFHDDLYFVDTASQNLFIYKDGKKSIIPEAKGCLIHHFVMNSHNNLIFISSMGVFIMSKSTKFPILCEDVSANLNFRGATTDVEGRPHFVAQDGIYSINEESKRLVKILPVDNGYGLAFDRENNIIYSDERTVTKLTPVDTIEM